MEASPEVRILGAIIALLAFSYIVMGVVYAIHLIRESIKERKSVDIVGTVTLAPKYREDLAYLKAYSRSRLKDRSLILSESKKEITPPVEEERKLEYTGIRAIQL